MRIRALITTLFNLTNNNYDYDYWEIQQSSGKTVKKIAILLIKIDADRLCLLEKLAFDSRRKNKN